MEGGVYRIPKYLDAPERYLFWTVDEAIVLISPIAVGILAGYFMVGLLVGPLALVALKKLKGTQGEQVLLNAFYWYLQTPLGPQFKVTPPSAIREYVG